MSTRRSAASRACSWTRSRPSSAATGSRSRAASATTRATRSRGSSRRGGSSSSGHTRRACSRSSRGRSSGARWRTAAAAGTATSARRTLISPTRSWPRSGERGPLASRHFEGSGGGGMWNWKPAKAMLERLWNHGDLVVAGRQGFQRVYDLAERVIPRELLEAPVPSEHETLLTLAEQAVRARGVAHRRGREGALAPEGRRGARPARRSTSWSRRGGCGACASTTAARTSSSRPRPSSTGLRRRLQSSSLRSTTCSGTGRSPGGSSASTT